MDDDATLLRRYVDERSEAAFSELVHRHVDLVYGAALRRTNGDAHGASDVAQQVFANLARHARELSRHPVLSAWLHTATRNVALNLMISDQRRKKREAKAIALNLANPADEHHPDWEKLRTLLDDAIDELPAPHRAAVVLRFLEGRPFADIAATLRLSEDATRMRVERALEKLRAALARRGVKSTAGALALAFANQVGASAPAGLTTTIATTALATTGVGAAAAFASFMNLKLVATATLSALALFSFGHYSGSDRGENPPPPLAETSRQGLMIATVREDNRRLAAEIAELHVEIARLKQANAALESHQPRVAPTNAAPTTRDVTLGMARWEIQQAMLNNLRQIDAARKQFKIEKGRLASSVHDLVGQKSYIKAVRTVNGEDYSQLSMNPDDPITVTAPNGTTMTYDPSGASTTQPEFPPEVLQVYELAERVQPSIKLALAGYRAANNGKNPPSEQALIPFFASPKDGADFVEYIDAKKAAGL